MPLLNQQAFPGSYRRLPVAAWSLKPRSKWGSPLTQKGSVSIRQDDEVTVWEQSLILLHVREHEIKVGSQQARLCRAEVAYAGMFQIAGPGPAESRGNRQKAQYRPEKDNVQCTEYAAGFHVSIRRSSGELSISCRVGKRGEE